MALTATDMAPLCGVNPKACLRKYGGRPLRTEYSHEIAIRLVAGALIRAASRYENAAWPVFSYYADHYVRLYAKIEGGARKADQCLKKMGFIFHCHRCSHRETASTIENIKTTECGECGSRVSIGGPLWLGELADTSFIDEMLEVSENSYVGSNRRLLEIIRLVRDEVDFPVGFYNIDRLCSYLSAPSITSKLAIQAIEEAGFRAVKTHFDRRGLKIDASISEVRRALREVTRGYLDVQ
jgi:tRNA (guanine26-N2/guanine27-N2)-dimethyltransferase